MYVAYVSPVFLGAVACCLACNRAISSADSLAVAQQKQQQQVLMVGCIVCNSGVVISLLIGPAGSRPAIWLMLHTPLQHW
jgi:hypothetical protein